MNLFKFSLFLFVSLALGCARGPLIQQEVKEVGSYDAKTFFKTINFTGASFSHDESKLLISSDLTGVFNVYSLPFAGGKMKQLTHSTKNSIFAVSYFPQDDRFLISADNEGDELSHVFVVDKGKRKDLTPGKKLSAGFLGWSKSKTHFYISTNERDQRFFDVYKYSAKNYKRSMVYKNTHGVSPGRISGDGRWLSISKVNSNSDSDIFLVDLKAKKSQPQLITQHEGQATYSPLTFTPDSQKLIYSTNAKGEFSQAWSYDLQTKEHRPYYKADWDVSYITFSESGRYRVVGINADAQTDIRVYDLKKNKELSLPKTDGNIKGVRFSPSEAKIAYYLGTDTSPANLYTLELDGSNPQRLTNSLNPKVKESDLVPGHIVRYKSFDGLKIPAILFKPWAASPKRMVPGVIFVHGGPGGQSRKGYSPMVQHLVNNGYAVLLVNNRGSSGYGKTFFHLDDKKHGDVDLKDCIWGRKFLEGLPWIQKDKVAIMGGSYGGYMVAAALAFEPDAFDVGINIFGVTNWLRTLESIPPYWEAFRAYLYDEVGDPVKDREALIAKSPLFHAEKIRKPLLVVQGANDPRVLQAESDEIVAKVRANKVPVEYVLFKDEGHGFRKRVNRIKASESYLKFLDKHLKKM